MTEWLITAAVVAAVYVLVLAGWVWLIARRDNNKRTRWK